MAASIAGYFKSAACFLFALFISCSPGDENITILARVGNRTISEQDFTQRAELSLLPFHDLNPENIKSQLIDLLICEKMMALEAEELNMDTSRIYIEALSFAEELAMARELYIEEVRNKVRIDEQEIKTTIDKMTQSRTVRFLLLPDRDRAESYRHRLSNGESFAKILGEIYGLSADTLGHRMTLTWGEGEPAVDEAVYTLNKVGEVSPVVPISRGFIIFILENIERNVMQTRMDYENSKRRAKTVLRARRESQRSGEFVSNFMRDKGVALDENVFPIFAAALLGQINFNSENIKVNTLQMDEIDRIQQGLAPHRHRILIRFRDGHWTVQEAIDRWRLCNLPLDLKSEEACRRSIVRNLSTMIRDKFLADEARRRSYQNRTAVVNQVTLWRDHFLYAMLKAQLKKSGRQPKIDWTGYLDGLKRKYTAKVDSDLIGKIELADIQLLAVRPGQYASLVVPSWPQFE